jgi:hypothetical protein
LTGDAAEALGACGNPLGPGLVHRIVREIQRRFWGSPDLTGVTSKYADGRGQTGEN